MTSFGVIVRSGRPYTLPTAPGASGRLHLTQVSLDDGPGKDAVTVRCMVSNKVPIIIARLLPRRSESLQLDLRYNLSEEATFSVLGPRNVHLAGYFDGLDVSADSESFGEDIAQSESEKSVDDDTYEGSFINDSDPGFSSSSTNSSFEAKERLRNGKKRSRQRLRKVGQIMSSTDSSGESGGRGTKIKAVVSDSDDDIEFYENSLLKRKLPANGLVEGPHQKSMSAFEDLTRSSEKFNDSAEKSVVPDTEGLLVNSVTKQSTTRKESKEGSNDANPGRLREKGTVEGELRHNIIEKTHEESHEDSHEAGKSARSHQITVEAATESKAKKKKHVKGDPSQNVNVHIHDAGKPETAIPCSHPTARETDLELKSKKKKKQVKGELAGTDELTKEQVSGIPIAMDEEKQLVSVRCLEAGEADHLSPQPNELVKDTFLRSKVKRKKHDVKGQNSAVVDNETETTSVMPATTEASQEKNEDESKKEKSGKCKKKRKRSEASNNATEVVDTETRVWTSLNGVVVEELVQGHPGGKIALPGKKISVRYVGKLEGSNDFSTSGNSPLKFRLGSHDAIAGWNEGLEGVRTGGKRRLTVPTIQSSGNDPAGSRMIYEIEVLRVR